MARRYGQILVSIWNDEKWWELTEAQQRLYVLIVSQADMNYCGVVPLRLSKWAKAAADSKPGRIAAALAVLQTKSYIVVDERHEEVWVRTFVKHNKVIEQDQLLKSLRSSYENIASPTIKAMVWDSVPEAKRTGMTPPDGHPGPQGGGSLPGSPNGACPPPPVIGVVDVSSGLDLDLEQELNLGTSSSSEASNGDDDEPPDWALDEAKRRLLDRPAHLPVVLDPAKWCHDVACNLATGPRIETEHERNLRIAKAVFERLGKETA